jgi:hypothetical protein
MSMKVDRLVCGLGVWLCFSACAARRSPETTAPADSANSMAVPAEERAPAPESPVAAPAPAAQRDTPKSTAARDDAAEFSSLEAAEQALNQAKADLDRLALAEPSPAIGSKGAGDSAMEKKESRPGRAPSAAGAAATSRANAVCDEACRAFSSLSRAAKAVCRLDGSGGTHCSHAKRVLSDAQQRVASCSCPASSD